MQNNPSNSPWKRPCAGRGGEGHKQKRSAAGKSASCPVSRGQSCEVVQQPQSTTRAQPLPGRGKDAPLSQQPYLALQQVIRGFMELLGSRVMASISQWRAHSCRNRDSLGWRGKKEEDPPAGWRAPGGSSRSLGETTDSLLRLSLLMCRGTALQVWRGDTSTHHEEKGGRALSSSLLAPCCCCCCAGGGRGRTGG